MRISTIQAFNNGVSGLQRNYANAIRTQEQISTGNRILTPADDPVASVRLLQLEQQQSVLSQYQSNLTAAKNSLTQEEVTLNSVNTILQQVRELTVQAGNGALSQTDRQSIAAELGQREDELMALMNTRNARGEYLFAGFQGKTQPYLRTADGNYLYQGDDGQRKLQVASSLELPISDMHKSRVQGALTLAGNDLRITPDTPALARTRGTVQFSEAGFALAGVQARALGGDVRLEGGMRPPPAGPAALEAPLLQLRAQGTASAEGLRQARELGVLAASFPPCAGVPASNACQVSTSTSPSWRLAATPRSGVGVPS